MALVDINTATKEELSTVDGLGESLAEAIIKHRETKGPFASVEGLLAVEGISDRLLAKLRDQLTVSAPVNESVVVLLTRPGGAAGDFTGHSVELTGTRTAPDTGAAVPFAAAGATTATGELTLAVPPRVTLVGTANFRVLAPDGTILATRAEAGPTLPQKVTIEVEPKVFGTTQPNTDPNAGAPTRLRGQVIDDSGKRIASGLQVVIWGATVANPTDADFRALLVVTTDARGHFTGPYPVGTFSAAHATVGVDDDPVTVPIHLEEERFPESVILVDRPPREGRGRGGLRLQGRHRGTPVPGPGRPGPRGRHLLHRRRRRALRRLHQAGPDAGGVLLHLRRPHHRAGDPRTDRDTAAQGARPHRRQVPARPAAGGCRDPRGAGPCRDPRGPVGGERGPDQPCR